MEYREGGVYGHAVIVWGGSEAGRNATASDIARAAICSSPGAKPCRQCAHCAKASRGIHPDILVTDRLEGKQNILVDQIRAIREDAVVMPNEAAKKVYIIRHAGTMNPQAQNALLKILEEPPESSNFILVAENPAELLSTVRSRCVELMSRSGDEPQAENEHVSDFEAALLGGALKLSAFSYTLEKLDRNSFGAYINGAEELLTSRLREVMTGGRCGLSEESLLEALRVLARAKEYSDVNVGLVHIAGMICAALMTIER